MKKSTLDDMFESMSSSSREKASRILEILSTHPEVFIEALLTVRGTETAKIIGRFYSTGVVDDLVRFLQAEQNRGGTESVVQSISVSITQLAMILAYALLAASHDSRHDVIIDAMKKTIIAQIDVSFEKLPRMYTSLMRLAFLKSGKLSQKEQHKCPTFSETEEKS